jgi:hypothetical protein
MALAMILEDEMSRELRIGKTALRANDVIGPGRD